MKIAVVDESGHEQTFSDDTVAATTIDTNEAHAATESTSHTEPGGIAAGAKALGIDTKLLLAQVVNFVILLLILRKFVYTPLLNVLDKRRETIEESLKKASDIEKQYKDFEIDHAKRIEESKVEASNIIAKAKEAAEELRQQSIADTQDETNKMLDKTKKEIDRQKEVMLAELKYEIGSLVVTATSKVVGAQVNEKMQTKLIDEALKEVE